MDLRTIAECYAFATIAVQTTLRSEPVNINLVAATFIRSANEEYETSLGTGIAKQKKKKVKTIF